MLSGRDSDQSVSNGTSTGASTESEGCTKQSCASPKKMILKETHTEEIIDLEKELSSESNGTSQSQEIPASLDPVSILHFSPESVLVVETLEDDGVSIIPPSPDALSGRITPLVIPSTPSIDLHELPVECEESILTTTKAEDSLKPDENLHRRITFSQESQDNTPLATRVAIAEHVKQLVTNMQSSGSEVPSKRSHYSSSDSSQETVVSTKRLKENSSDEAKMPSQQSPLGGRTYKMVMKHDRAGSISPRGLPSVHERQSAKKASRPTALFTSQESVTALPFSQEDCPTWHLRLTGMEATPPNVSNEESDAHDAGEREELRKEETVYTSALEGGEEGPSSDNNDDSVHLEETDRRADFEPQQMKILSYRNAAPRAILSERRSSNAVSDTQELPEDPIRKFRSVRGRQDPVISSQSQDNGSQSSENSTQIISSRNAATKRIHSEEEERRVTRPKTCNSSVQTDGESPLTDNDTPNTSREVVLLKPSQNIYHHRIREEHTTYLMKCTEDGKVVKSIFLQSKTNYRMATDEEIGYLISSSNSSTGTTHLSHMSSLTSGEMADISSMCPSSKSTSASSLHSLQQQSVPYVEQTSLDHSKDSDRSPNGSLEKQLTCFGKKPDLSTRSSSCESLPPRDPLFTRPSLPSKRTPIPRFQSSPSDSSSGPSMPSTFSETRSANKASAKSAKVPETNSRRRGRLRKDEKSQTPDTAKIRLCSPHSPELSTTYAEVDETEDIDRSIQVVLQPGLKVMAKWRDNYFYFGEIKKEESSAGSATKCWFVMFHDGCTRSLREEDIFSFDLLQEGQSVFAHSTDGCIEPGVIQGFFRTSKEEGFIVDLDSGVSRRCSHADVVLSVDQAACIKNGRVCPNMTAVSLDNIVDGRRKRTPVLKTPRKSRKPDPNLETTEVSDTSEDPHKTPLSRYKSKQQAGKGGSPGRKGKLLPVNLAHQLKTPEDTVKSTRSSPRRKEAMAALISAMGPMPEEGSTIFQNFAVLISYADRKHVAEKIKLLVCGRVNSSSEQSTSDCTDSVEEPSVLVDKHYLQSQLEAGGGEVLDSFESAQLVKGRKVILVANSHLRTLKYIQCLAAGIPCINITWVTNCCQKNQHLDESQYLLPSGYSITTNKLVEWHGNSSVLKDLHIMLVSRKNQDFLATWKPLLLAAEAVAIHRLTSSEVTETSVLVDVVVTDFSCPEKVLDRATNLKIPVVSTEWVVQCLINGCRLPANGHPKFRFDYKE